MRINLSSVFDEQADGYGRKSTKEDAGFVQSSFRLVCGSIKASLPTFQDGKVAYQVQCSILKSVLLNNGVWRFTFDVSSHYNPIQERTVIPHITPIEDLL
jgi:hypothetical protein